MWRTRGYGDFYSYMLLAEGAVDLACEPELALYDMGALVPIVTEAGGAFTNTAGVPGPFGGNAVASNSHLQDAALDLLGRVAPKENDGCRIPAAPGCGPPWPSPRAGQTPRGPA